LNIDFLHIDEEVFDSVTGNLSHTVGQLPVCNGDGKQWLLGPGRFRLYGLSESVMAASIGLATPLSSPSCTIQIPLTSKIKVEPGLQSITILSDDSNMCSPLQATPTKTFFWTSPSLDPSIESLVCKSKTFSHLGQTQPSNILDYLKKLRAS
jgi:hypothetical protein